MRCTYCDVCVYDVLLALSVDELAGELIHRGGHDLQARVRPGEATLEGLDLALQHVKARSHRGQVQVQVGRIQGQNQRAD